MTKFLNDTQIELLMLFYSLPKIKVIYSKTERKVLWDQATKRSSIGNFESIEKVCPSFLHRVVKSYSSGKNIQSAVFSECVFSQTLANMLNLTEFYISEELEGCIPKSYKKLLAQHNLHARYVYSNQDKTKMLIQAGGCNGIDCALILQVNGQEKFYTIEFKERNAKTSEPDLPKYHEDGNLFVTSEFLSKNPQFEEMLKEQEGLNFFEIMGNNVHDFSSESINIAVTNNYSQKYADVVVTEDKNDCLIMLPTGDIDLWADIEGEIRPAGRNPYKVWTPNSLKRFIIEQGGIIENNIVKINKSNLVERKQRGNKEVVSGYKINPLFFVRLEDCTQNGMDLVFNLNDVWQLNPTIAGKMFFKKSATYEAISNFYMKQNRN